MLDAPINIPHMTNNANTKGTSDTNAKGTFTVRR